MVMASSKPTRGYGALEGFLARKRSTMANRLLSPCPSGRVLDIGCGQYPVFLARSRFHEKYGLDREEGRCYTGSGSLNEIRFSTFDADIDKVLPFPLEFFDAVTMLAVIEHLGREVLEGLAKEVFRVLAPSGCFVLTTPAAWTEPLLKALAKAGLVSSEEIDEHKDLYNRRTVEDILAKAGFSRDSITSGFFEWGMNIWVRAVKNPS